jgi:hypothetical protein
VAFKARFDNLSGLREAGTSAAPLSGAGRVRTMSKCKASPYSTGRAIHSATARSAFEARSASPRSSPVRTCALGDMRLVDSLVPVRIGAL